MIKELHKKLKNKEITAVELAESFLKTLEEKNGELNAILTVTREEALEQARAVDVKIEAGEEIDILAGIPLTVKDVILTKGIRSTGASKVLENYIAPHDADIVGKLKERGAVILGKNNCDEFAMGGSNENSAFGPVKNPHNPERVSGGSSGGSACAVASEMSAYSLGTDTGGSVRQPASYCGVVGFKPSYGTVSRYGLMPMASSLDQAGLLTQTVEDAEIVFEAIKGKSKNDATSFDLTDAEKTERKDLQGLKFGLPKEFFDENLDAEIKEIIFAQVEKIKSLGGEVVEVSLPYLKHALAVYYVISPAEVSANMMRYDGIRYGQSVQDGEDLAAVYKDSRTKFFGPEVKRRIMLGTYVLSAGYYDAYYKKAQKVRTLIKKDFERVFEEVDFLVTPTTPSAAFLLGEKKDNPLEMYLEDIYTVPVNIAGLPALSIPAGNDKDKMPVGLQVIGDFKKDNSVLEVGKIMEKGKEF
jgi:aspartyl-tRNA(Asn)/glutamyl-tRNA(Gln) amidotransferase subunit A